MLDWSRYSDKHGNVLITDRVIVFTLFRGKQPTNSLLVLRKDPGNLTYVSVRVSEDLNKVSNCAQICQDSKVCIQKSKILILQQISSKTKWFYSTVLLPYANNCPILDIFNLYSPTIQTLSQPRYYHKPKRCSRYSFLLAIIYHYHL